MLTACCDPDCAYTNVDVVLTACCVDRLAALHRINTPNFLGAMVSLPLSQQTNAKKSMATHVADLDAELAAYSRGPRGASAPAGALELDRPPPIDAEDEAEEGAEYERGRVSSPPIGSPTAAAAEAYEREGEASPRSVGGAAAGEGEHDDTQLGAPPNGAGSYPVEPPLAAAPEPAPAPAPAPVVAVVRARSAESTGGRKAEGGGAQPREDGGEQWAEVIPPLLAALSGSSGAGSEERRRALSQLGALSRRATPTLWAKYFGQLLLLVLEALKDDDAP